MQVRLLPHLQQPQIHPSEHPHHLLHTRVLSSHVVLRVQRIDEVKHCSRLLALSRTHPFQVELVLIVEAVVKSHLHEEFSWRLCWKVLDNGSNHEEEGVGLESSEEVVVEVEGFAEFLKD